MTGLSARLTEFRVALMLLTRVPVGRVGEPLPDLARIRWSFPLVGVPVGLIGWGVHGGFTALGAGPALAAVATLGALIFVTGGLHHDGLADFADGIGGGRDRDRCLEIMRDSRIGSYGALALIVTLGLWVAALAQLGPVAALAAFLAIGIGSRFGMVVLLDWLPAARPDGLGAQAGGRDRRAVGVGAAMSVLALCLLGSAGFAVGAAMALAAGLVAWQARRHIGGQTGDVLGAAQILSESAGWVALALPPGRHGHCSPVV